MKWSSKELLPLWRPALALLAACATAWTIVGYAEKDLQQAQAQVQTHSKARDEARQRFQRSDEEKAMILKYLPAYDELKRQGFVGAENRLEWIESLRVADRKAGLDGVQFRIDPQEKLEHSAVNGVIAGRLRRSTMRLTLGLTHEVDLLEFIDALQKGSAGVFSVRACTMTGRGNEPVPRQANLHAECELDWYTVNSAEPSA